MSGSTETGAAILAVLLGGGVVVWVFLWLFVLPVIGLLWSIGWMS